MILREALAFGKEVLKEAGIAEYELDAWLLLEYAAGIGRAAYYIKDRETLDAAAERKYREALEKRRKRIPLQHITGVQEFMGYEFQVNEHVLIPRQDTETVVEEADRFCRRLEEQGSIPRILDMCTGSGCILLSLLKMDSTGKRTGMGVDISEKALDTARENRRRLLIPEEKAVFVQSDLFADIRSIGGRGELFDLIVSNPPYIKTAEIAGLEAEVRLYDPFLALDGKEDGLSFYRRITEAAGSWLKTGGMLLFEIGHDQGEAAARLLANAGFTDIFLKKDLAGLDRAAGGVYNIARENEEELTNV